MAETRTVIPITHALAIADQEEALYEVRRKIYPRAVHGWFANWRVTMVVFTQALFYGLPWFNWNERQAVLFDLGARKFYIFGVMFLPQDFIYLTLLLVISALSLFLFTAVAGRLWCGYACPQTVYTEMFMWIEQKIEGGHVKQKRLDSAPWSARKIAIKGAKHAAWIALSLWTGFTFVGYFTPIKDLAAEVARLSLGPWETFWVLFYGFATYGNAGFMREQVCKYMCPYARFQSVMFDRDTLVITYDTKRGEPRGPRSRQTDIAVAGLGHCVDCEICVQVCPTGIDIRQGLQYECIGCAACIDGCDQVMDKMGYPRGLIRYATENALDKGYSWKEMVRRVLRPRTLVYTGVLWAIITTTGASVWLRVPLKVNVIRDRATLARQVDAQHVENVYQLRVMNADEKPHRFLIRATGLKELQLLSDPQPLEIGPGTTRTIPVRLLAEIEHAQPGSHRIEFVIEASDDEKHALPEVFSLHENSAFIIPH